MATPKILKIHKGFTIQTCFSGSRAGQICIKNPDGCISPIVAGSKTAAIRIIDTFIKHTERHNLC